MMSEGQTQPESGENIGTRFFYHKIDGIEAMVLFPALTTPCLVGASGVMNVIVAVHRASFKELGTLAQAPIRPNEALPLTVAQKFHSQLLFLPWGDGHATTGFRDTKNGNWQDKNNNWKNLIYGTFPRLQNAYNAGWYQAYYLQELIYNNRKVLVNIHEADGTTKPMGILAESAVELCNSRGYVHLFQLRFTNFFEVSGAGRDAEADCLHQFSAAEMATGRLFELVFLFRPYAPEKDVDAFSNFSDVAVVENFTTTLNAGLLEADAVAQQYAVGRPADATNKYTDYGKLGTLPVYHLLKSSDATEGSTEAQENDNVENGSSNTGAYRTQEGAQPLYAYHPVFIKKEITKLGVMADLHLSSRQTLYKLPQVKAQVIPGAPEEYSPYIGRMSHENLTSSSFLLEELTKQCDITIIAGDMYDHCINIVPSRATINNTASLWNYLDYSAQQAAYAPHIDGLMMLQLILASYQTTQKPIFFITGNHEGYQHPYGISPRLCLGPLEIMKPNAGIPGDHNLTIYEAGLLFGPAYGSLHKKYNFTRDVMRWVYQVFTPWSDYYVPHDSVDIAGLGWGNDEGFTMTALAGGGALPRAYDAITAQQLTLAERASERGNGILCTHFAHVSYDPSLPLNTMQTFKNASKDAVQSVPTGFVMTQFENPHWNKANIGGFEQNRIAMDGILHGGGIKYMISGHAHRCGIYKPTIEEGKIQASAYVPPDGTLVDTVQCDGSFHAVITGSAGPMSVQNVANELKAQGMDYAQALTVDLKDNRIEVVRYPHEKPRLASVMAYLKDLYGIKPFERISRVGLRDVTPIGDIYLLPSPCPGHSILDEYLSSQDVVYIFIGEAPNQYIQTPRLWKIDNSNKKYTCAIGRVPSEFYTIFQGSPVHSISFFSTLKNSPDINQRLFTITFDLTRKYNNYFCITGNVRFVSEGYNGGEALTTDSIHGFISMSFIDYSGLHPAVKNLLHEHYDMSKYPWCMPATLKAAGKNGAYWLDIDWRELPDFDAMKVYDEFT